jgi:hypothetical protein
LPCLELASTGCRRRFCIIQEKLEQSESELRHLRLEKDKYATEFR